MENLKPNARRAKIATTLIWIVLAFDVLKFFSDALEYNLLQNAANAIEVTEDEVSWNDLRQQALSIGYLLVFIISGITFIQWFRRAYYNLGTRLSDLDYKDSWAAGCWFVPIISLYRPFQMMRELYERTERLLQEKGSEQLPERKAFMLGLWWTFWILTTVTGQIVFRASLKADTLPDMINLDVISMVDGLLNIPLAFITVRVIKNYAVLEKHLSELHVPETDSFQAPLNGNASNTEQ